MDSVLEINDLHVAVEGKEILKGVDLSVSRGKIHALMGPNGSGKSTLACAVMGHPRYQITKGSVLLFGQNINELTTDERARRGLFLAFQYPSEISGLSVANFLRTALSFTSGQKINVFEFHNLFQEKMKLLEIDESLAGRYLNEGFSGGEKKKSEIVQMLVLQPKFALLDEIDSGLDVDALRIIAQAIQTAVRDQHMGIVLVTHYTRIVKYLKPDRVHIFTQGKIVASGGMSLAEECEAHGYEGYLSA